MANLSQRVKERMVLLKLTQTQLAELVGVKQSSVWSLLNNEIQKPRFILELARALHTTPEWLTEGRDPPLDPYRALDQSGFGVRAAREHDAGSFTGYQEQAAGVIADLALRDAAGSRKVAVKSLDGARRQLAELVADDLRRGQTLAAEQYVRYAAGLLKAGQRKA